MITTNTNKIGFLDRDGTLRECKSFDHLDYAHEIVSTMGQLTPGMNRLDAEDFLQDLGWLVVRARDIYGKIGYLNKEGKILYLSDKQKSWLLQEYGNFPTTKQRDADWLIDNGG